MSNPPTSDKTYNEIEAAYNAGKRIYCSLLDNGTLGSPASILLTIRRVGISTTDFIFIGSVGLVGLEYSIKISNKDIVTVEYKQFMEDREITAADVGALPATGGTLSGNLTITNGSALQSGEPYLTWKTVNTNTPYVGFAQDQTDGTFILCSLKGTDYRSGLAIGGGSGNLLWKGTKVATISDVPTEARINALIDAKLANIAMAEEVAF